MPHHDLGTEVENAQRRAQGHLRTGVCSTHTEHRGICDCFTLARWWPREDCEHVFQDLNCCNVGRTRALVQFDVAKHQKHSGPFLRHRTNQQVARPRRSRTDASHYNRRRHVTHPFVMELSASFFLHSLCLLCCFGQHGVPVRFWVVAMFYSCPKWRNVCEARHILQTRERRCLLGVRPGL